MRYDDRDDITPRRDDNIPPRRPSGPDSGGGLRSGGTSRPQPYGGDRPSRPRNPDERVSNTPSRPRGPGTPPSNVPSRPRPAGGAGGPTPRSNMGQRGQSARDAMHRVRDAASSMYEVMNRELRSFGQRVGEGRQNAGRDAPPSRPQPRDYPSAFDGDERGFGDAPARGNRPADARVMPGGGDRALTTTTGTRAVGHPRHSLVRRLRDRRAKLHGEKRGVGLSKTGQAMLVVLLLVVVAGGGLLSGYSYFLAQKNAQAIQLLAINRDAQTTRIYDRNGVLLYQIYGDKSGRRDYITYCQIPPVVMHATVDTEDASFWSNPGFDAYHDIIAAYKNLKTQSIQSGASTITEQLVKNAVLNDDRQNVGRKLDEAILAVNLTQQYTKQQILTMYLNEVSYGPLDYGIEAAAENYFGLKPTTISLDDYRNNKLPPNRPDEKAFVDHLYAADGCHPPSNQTSVIESGAWQLQNWQAELLAGVPQNPNNQSPYLHPQASVLRMRDGVLPNMMNNGDSGDLTLNGQPITGDNASKIAQIVKTAWLTICEYDPTPAQTSYLPTCPNKSADPSNPNANRKIHDSVQVGNGTSSGELAPYFVDYVIQQLEQSLPRDAFATQGWNIYTTLDYGDPQLTETQLKHVSIDYATGKLQWDNPNSPDVKGFPITAVGLQQYAEYITKRNITEPYPDEWYCGFGYSSPQVGTLPSPSAAGGNKPACTEAPLNEPASFVRYTNGQRQDGKDANDAALVAIDPRNGDILAMVGGIDYDQINYAKTNGKSGGENNLATSKYRSMGSSTKPIIYATAFQMGWNPGTIVRDQPTCFPYASPPSNAQDPKNDEYLCPKNYLPHNYEAQNWAGAEPLTMELGNSLNTPATMAMSFDGIYPTSPVLSMARRLGVTTLDPTQLGPSTALGSQDIPLYQLTSAYGTFANNGVRVPERAILQITDPFGNQVKDSSGNPFYPYVAHPTGYQALSPQTAYEITSILTNNDARVGNFGHVNPLYFPGRDVAAKTGTSQSIEDIVTMGYTPSLALGVWVGNADLKNTALTGDIIGIAGAAYIFNAVMAFAIVHYHMPGTPPSYGVKAQPGGSFPIPPNMQRVVLSCYTGLAPYQGQDATDSFGGGCNHAKEYVPPQMKGEMFNGTWSCIGWGCNDSHDAINLPGTNTAWIPSGPGQIPMTP